MALSIKWNMQQPSAEDREASFRAKLIGTAVLIQIPQKFFSFGTFGLLIFVGTFLPIESFNLTPLSALWWGFFVDGAAVLTLVPIAALFNWISHKRYADFAVEQNRYRVVREGDKFHAHTAPQWKWDAKDRRDAARALLEFPESICPIVPSLFVLGISCISIVSPWLIDEERMEEFFQKMTALLPAGYCIRRLPESRLDLFDSLYVRLPYVGVPAWRKRKDGWRLRAIGIEIRRQ